MVLSYFQISEGIPCGKKKKKKLGLFGMALKDEGRVKGGCRYWERQS